MAINAGIVVAMPVQQGGEILRRGGKVLDMEGDILDQAGRSLLPQAADRREDAGADGPVAGRDRQ